MVPDTKGLKLDMSIFPIEKSTYKVQTKIKNEVRTPLIFPSREVLKAFRRVQIRIHRPGISKSSQGFSLMIGMYSWRYVATLIAEKEIPSRDTLSQDQAANQPQNIFWFLFFPITL